jgi:prophage maintenance system killer protein
MNMSLILNGYKMKVNTPDELLARILDAAASIRKREDQLRRTTRDLRTRVEKCSEVDGGIFEHLL